MILIFKKNGFPNDDISFLFEIKYLGKAMMVIFGSKLEDMLLKGNLSPIHIHTQKDTVCAL